MSTRVLAGWLPCAIATALLAGRATAVGQVQSPQSQSSGQPMFRSTTSLVEVDVIVHDSHDQFVTGLTANDLTVLEDGKPQAIEQCYLVSLSTAYSAPPADLGPPDSSEGQNHRIFVLVFDEADLETSALLRIKDGAERFLASQFQEGDFGGVVVSGELFQGKLTRSRSTLMAALRAVKPALDSRQKRLLPFRQFPQIPGEAEAERIANGDVILTQQLGTADCQLDAVDCSMAGGVQQVENRLQEKAKFYIAQARDATRYTLQSLRQVVGALASMPGRKTVVFMSDGFYSSESTNELRQLGGIAARASEAIYAIDGRGLSGGPPEPADVVTSEGPISAANDRNDDAAGLLADGTGGLVVRHATDIGRALNDIATDTSTYYVVGYRPTNSTMDGKYRKIEVKTTKPGLHIRARTGYVAAPLPPLAVK